MFLKRDYLALTFRYFFVGGTVGVIYFAISWLLLTQCSLHLYLIATIAFIVTSPISYLCHRVVTFKTSRNFNQLLRFGFSVCLMLSFSYLVEKFFSHILSEHILIALTWIVSSFINFFVYTFYVFQEKSIFRKTTNNVSNLNSS